MGDGTVYIVIPALNEADNLGPVLTSLPTQVGGRESRVIVVDDGSSDGTAAVAVQHGAKVISHDRPEGGGSAVRHGIEAALAEGADVIVTMDADGQHIPADMGKLVTPVIRGELDLVNGSRRLGNQSGGSLVRRVGVTSFSWLASALLAQRVTDISNGYRAFSALCASEVAPRQPQFHAPETFIRAWRLGYRVGEVPVTVKPRLSGESKKPKSMKYGWGFLRSILVTRFGRLS